VDPGSIHSLFAAAAEDDRPSVNYNHHYYYGVGPPAPVRRPPSLQPFLSLPLPLRPRAGGVAGHGGLRPADAGSDVDDEEEDKDDDEDLLKNGFGGFGMG
jgi:hypothetical protein